MLATPVNRPRVAVQRSGATSDAAAARKGIINAWNGKHADYEISVELGATDAPTVTLTVIGRGIGNNTRGGGRSFGRGKGGELQMDVSDNRSDTGRLAAHEFGHVLGIVPHSLNPANLMGKPAGTNIRPEDVATLIKKCGPEQKAEAKPAEGEKQ